MMLLIAHCVHAQNADTTKRAKLFEISFGRSVLFISNSRVVDLRNSDAVVVPTTSILLLAEFRPEKKIRIPVFFNLATETKQFLINGNLTNEKASPTFGFGLQYRPFAWDVDEKTRLEFEMGPLLSVLITQDKKLLFAPIMAGRIRLWKGESVSMYVGTSYSFGIDCWGLLYGTGTIF
ncbi:MAG: hypothetical protein ACKVOR_00305 [Flavobacteriales bacterium]